MSKGSSPGLGRAVKTEAWACVITFQKAVFRKPVFDHCVEPFPTWLQLIFRSEGFSLNMTQELGGRLWETLVGQPHVLLPDGQGTEKTLTRHLKVIHGHLSTHTTHIKVVKSHGCSNN